MSMLIIEVPTKECNYKETRQLPPDLINYYQFDGFDKERYLFYPPDGEVRIPCPYPSGMYRFEHPDRPDYIMITYRLKGVPYRELVAVIKCPIRCDHDDSHDFCYPLKTYLMAKKEGQLKIAGVPLKILYSNNWPKIFFTFRYQPENLYFPNDNKPIFILDEQDYYTSQDRRIHPRSAFDQDVILIEIPYNKGGLIGNYPVVQQTSWFLQDQIEDLIKSKNLHQSWGHTLMERPYAGWNEQSENYKRLMKIGLEAAIDEMPEYVERCVRNVSDNLADSYNDMLHKIWKTYNDFLNGLLLSREEEKEEENKEEKVENKE